MVPIDDLKQSNLQPQEQTMMQKLLQNYADGQGRERLSHQTITRSDTIHGFLVISGEEVLVKEASNISRSIILDANTFAKKTEQIKERFESCLKDMSDYSKITAAFIQWMQLNTKTIKTLFTDSITNHHKRTQERKHFNSHQ